MTSLRIVLAATVMLAAGRAFGGDDSVKRAESAANPGDASRVPAWDARGVGPLPWQGIACLQANDDLSLVAVGTIAPPGDQNVVLIDGAGKLVRTYAAGERWVDQLVLDPEHTGVFALSTMPKGTADDFCTLFACFRDVTPLAATLTQHDFPQNLFHYGDHSNHSGARVVPFRWRAGEKLSSDVAALVGNAVQLFSGAAPQTVGSIAFPRPTGAVSVSLAGSNSGRSEGLLLAGCTARNDRHGPITQDANLFLMSAIGEHLWNRPVVVDVDTTAAPERGPYGSPTLPDGFHNELPQFDVRVSAPLSVALFDEAQTTRIAAADYPGWQRWIRSSATRQDQNYGVRFLPARPMIAVYDGRGKTLRRFAPHRFREPAWLDLRFIAGGRQLVAYPHSWTSRGLAGQSLLPADAKARFIYRLDVETGDVQALEFPDGISDVAVCAADRIVAGCWDGRVYSIGDEQWRSGQLPPGIDVGGPTLVALSRDGLRMIAATTAGVIRQFDAEGHAAWQTDLNQAVPRVPKPWLATATAEQIGEGVWQIKRGRVESDYGGQRVIEAPDGLILIEGHAGLSFEWEWAQMVAAGLDPLKVRYVLATHEHGDHAPGAYLWRVVTGAQFVCSEEMAYTLQHHIPLCSGYGFHPPVPTDIRVREDTDLDLAGLKVRAVRVPGHTAGSMGWMFTKGGKKYVAIGDLIMPDGLLGYAGSINFSAADVLTSLRKLEALKVDVVLPGHGPWGDPNRYIAAGISVGRHVGWGKTPAEEPDPYFRLTQKNVLVAAWNIDAVSAAFGDIDGDKRPDVAIVAPDGKGSVVKLFLNKGGRFDLQPDRTIPVESVNAANRIRMGRFGDGTEPGFLISGDITAVLSHWPEPKGENGSEYYSEVLPIGDVHQVHPLESKTPGSRDFLLGRKSGAFEWLRRTKKGQHYLSIFPVKTVGPYADLQVVDLNRDQRPDLVSQRGQVFLQPANGVWPDEPTQTLPVPMPDDWHFLAVGDFNADQQTDVVLASYGMKQIQAALFLNRGDMQRPFGDQADVLLDLAEAFGPTKPVLTLLRDAPAVADWNGDGAADLLLARGQDQRVLVLYGGSDGLSLQRSTMIPLDYRLHFETGLSVADYNGDGRPDLAALGYTNTGVGSSGPLAAYIWLQPQEKSP